MASNIQRIGVLTGGGDCPGLNAVIRAVTKSAINRYGFEVVGIEDGFLGLIENHMLPLDTVAVSNILTVGGTILGSNNKVDPTAYLTIVDGKKTKCNVIDHCIENIHANGLDALVVIGGDGTMTVASKFVEKGVICIGVPKTIDNDLVGTDVTFGFGSAVATATDALDKVHTTAASHHRAMVVEVMGRNAGWIALYSGVASGSDVILLPEIPYDIDKVCEFVVGRSHKGKRFSILCVSEGAMPKDGKQVVATYDEFSPEPVRLGGVGKKVADDIEDATGIETRAIVLGHVQRGGSPIPQDRVLATEFGNAATELLAQGKRNRLVVMKGRTVTDAELLAAAGKQRTVPLDSPLVAAARNVGTCFGD